MEGYFTRNQDPPATAEPAEENNPANPTSPAPNQPPYQQPSYPYQQQPGSMPSTGNSPAQSPASSAAQPPGVVVNYNGGPNGPQPPGPPPGANQAVPPHAFPFYPGVPPPPQDGSGDGQERNGSPGQGMPQMVPMIYPGMPMHMAYPYPPGMVPPASLKSKRRQVKNACTNCQKACKKCDDVRPCSRCVKYGISDECADSQRKERKKGVKRGPYKKRDAKGNPEMGDPDMLGMPNGGETNGGPAMSYVAGYPPGFYSQFATGQPLPKPDGSAYYPQYYLHPVGHHPQDGENMPQAPFYPAPYLGGPVPYGHQPYAAYAVPPPPPRADSNGSPNSNGANPQFPYPYNNGVRTNGDGNPYAQPPTDESGPKSPKGKRHVGGEDEEQEDAEEESGTNHSKTNGVAVNDHD